MKCVADYHLISSIGLGNNRQYLTLKLFHINLYMCLNTFIIFSDSHTCINTFLLWTLNPPITILYLTTLDPILKKVNTQFLQLLLLSIHYWMWEYLLECCKPNKNCAFKLTLPSLETISCQKFGSQNIQGVSLPVPSKNVDWLLAVTAAINWWVSCLGNIRKTRF